MLVRRDVLEQLGFDDLLPVLRQRPRLRLAGRPGRPPHGGGARRRWCSTPRPPTAGAASPHVVDRTRAPRERAAAITTLLANGSAARCCPAGRCACSSVGCCAPSGSCWCAPPGRPATSWPGSRSSTDGPAECCAARRARRRTATVPRAGGPAPARAGLAALPARPRLRRRRRSARRRRRGARRACAAPRRATGRTAGRRTGDRAGHLGRRSRWPSLAAASPAAACWAAAPLARRRAAPAARRGRPLVAACWSQRWHYLGTGSAAPAPPYVLPLALSAPSSSATPGPGRPCCSCWRCRWPLLRRYRFLRRRVDARPMSRVWGAAAYGAAAGGHRRRSRQGRLGTVAAAVVLPWLRHLRPRPGRPPTTTAPAAGRLAYARSWLARARRRSCRRPASWSSRCCRWRAVRRTGRAAGLAPPARRPAGRRAAAAAAVAGRHPGRARGLAVRGRAARRRARAARGAGPAGRPQRRPGPGARVDGRSGCPVAALVALAPRRHPRQVLPGLGGHRGRRGPARSRCSWAQVELPGLAGRCGRGPASSCSSCRPALVVAAAIAGGRRPRALRAGRLRLAAAVLGGVAALGALAAPVLGRVLVGRPADGDRTGRRRHAGPLPAYMTEVSAASNRNAVLVLRGGGAATDVRYRVLRDGTAPPRRRRRPALDPGRRELTATRGRAAGRDRAGELSAGSRRTASPTSTRPPPVSAAVSGAFDAAERRSPAPARRSPGSRAWRVRARRRSARGRPDRPRPVHAAVLIVQVVALIGVVVLVLPGRRRR